MATATTTLDEEVTGEEESHPLPLSEDGIWNNNYGDDYDALFESLLLDKSNL
jgi:hypothetical protein